MKRILFFICIIIVTVSPAQVSVQGTVTSASTGEALPGAVVYFPDLRKGVMSNENGAFSIRDLPSIKTLVQIKLIGYKTFVRSVDLQNTNTLKVSLDESVNEEEE